MSKYFGQIGFAKTVEYPEGSGIWIEDIEERSYYGEVYRISRRYGSDSKINEDVDISNQISILSDDFAFRNLYNIKYITWLGNKWKVTNVSVVYPRLTLDIGGLYHEGPSIPSDDSGGETGNP